VDVVDSKEVNLHYPMKLLGFVEKDDGSPICFGQMCPMQSWNEKDESYVGLFEHWYLEIKPNSGDPIYQFVDMNTALGHCLVFQFTENTVYFQNCSVDSTKQVIVMKD
jgi:hypothetical protein